MQSDTITIDLGSSSIENLKLPDPSLVTYYNNLSKRIIWMDDEIGEYSLEIVRKIIEWNGEDEEIKEPHKRKPIRLMFFTPGGSLDVNNTIIDTIKLSKTPIWGVNMGMCASAGAFIYLSCHMKFMLPSSYFLFHQGSAMIGGTFQQSVDHMEDYKTKVEKLSDYLAEHTQLPTEMIQENLKKEWFIYKDDAVKYRVCDGIVADMNILI